jgi:hypothetical protein
MWPPPGAGPQVDFFSHLPYKKNRFCDLFWRQLTLLRKKDRFEVGGYMKGESVRARAELETLWRLNHSG